MQDHPPRQFGEFLLSLRRKISQHITSSPVTMRYVLLAAILLTAISHAAPLGDIFKPDKRWNTCGKVSANGEGNLDISEKDGTSILTNAPDFKGAPYLETVDSYGDCSVEMEFMISKGSNSGVYLMGRYEVQILDSHGKDKVSFSDLGGIYELWDDNAKPQGSGGTAPSANAAKPPGEWQTLSIRFRAPRLDETSAAIEKPVFLSVKVNGVEVQKNTTVDGPTRANPRSGAAAKDGIFIQGDHGPIAIRKFEVTPESFPEIPPGAAMDNGKMLDLVRYGGQSFQSLGCAQCHSVLADDPAVRTGPSLFGLFHTQPREREVIHSDDKTRHMLKADLEYFTRSLRSPATELAISENGATKGNPFLPVMPPYPDTVIDDLRLTAIHHYLRTLNEASAKGPDSVMIEDTRVTSPQDPSLDPAEILVTDRTRAFRARLDKGSSRAVYVGTPAGLNYSFDPINLSFRRVWWGGFLNLKNEMDGRANKVSSLGHEAKELPIDAPLLVPLHAETGAPIDLSFKSPLHKDYATIEKNLYGNAEFADQLAAAGAKFLGYTLSRVPAGEPTFHYRIGENDISLSFHGEQSGKAMISLSGNFKTPQTFTLNAKSMAQPSVNLGELKEATWIVPAGETISAELAFTLPPAPSVWRPVLGAAPVLSTKVTSIPSAGLVLPLGYSGVEIPPPLDRNGRPQLFEPLGMDFAKDGTMVVSTRTAGVWSYKDGTWKQIADGLLDAMGVVIEKDDLSEIVVGQKPELTRLIDHDGDGMTDEYRTISDDFGITTNYHEYLHGPAKGGDGNYYVALNLGAEEGRHIFKNGAKWMGTTGGYRGWCLQITPDGITIPFASGLRSPAGLGTGPDGLIYYSDNQGSYFGTSKYHRIGKGNFYGQPAGLVDLPGLNPDSPELKWENVESRNEPAIALLPHSHLSNSPGSPTWNLTGGKFGPTEGHVFMGDQTLSTLFQIVVNSVDNHEEAAMLPFGKGFPSGVMRMGFAPDGSLYVGQTGRGWRSQGGNEAALVRIIYDSAKAAPIVENITRSGDTYTISFSGPMEDLDPAKATVASWTYVDSSTYGSPETDRRDEKIHSAVLAQDKKSLALTLAPLPTGQRLLQFRIMVEDKQQELYYSKR